MPYRMPGDAHVVVDYAGVSIAGRGRDANEDAWTALESVSLFVVADGHGTLTTSGRIAADIAVKSLRQGCGGGGPRLVEPFAVAALEASAKIRRHPGIGAAIAALRIEPPWTVAAAVGGCRTYRYRRGFGAEIQGVDPRGGLLERLTVDHHLWRELVKRGASFDEVREALGIHAGVVTRVLGWGDSPDVDVTYAPLQDGDVYLLTTEGVTRQLDDAEIQAIVGDERHSLAARCDRLVEAANAKPGADDITAVLVRVSM